MAEHRARSILPALRLGVVSLASALAMMACGGGGDPASKPPAAVTDTSGGAGPNGGPTATPAPFSHYQASESSRADLTPGKFTRTLNVIDMDTGTVVRQYALPSTIAPPDSLGRQGPDWFTTARQVPTPDRLGSTHYGAGLLHFIQNGHIMQLDLSGLTLGVARQVSNATACWFVGDATPLNAEANQFWHSAYMAGSTGDCKTSLDNSYRLVSSGMNATDAPRFIEQTKELIDTLHDAQGQVLGLLAVDRSDLVGGTLRLGVWSADLQTRLQTITPSPAVKMTGLPITVRRIARLPADARQSLIQIGAKVYKLDWRTGTALLSPALFTSTDVIDGVIIERDSQVVYMADACLIRSIDANGLVSVVATLPADSGHIVQLGATPGKLLTIQAPRVITTGASASAGNQCGSTLPDGQARLRAIDKTSHAITLLDSSPNAADFRLLARAGEQFFAATTDGFVRTATTNIRRYNTSGANSPVAIVNNVKLLAVARPLLESPGLDGENGQILWCTLGLLGDCRGGRLLSFATDTGTPTELGILPAAAPAGFNGTSSFSINEISVGKLGLWANKAGLLSLRTDFSTSGGQVTLSTPWWLVPDGQGSLRPISLASGPAP